MKTIAYALVALVSVVATTGCEDIDSVPEDGTQPEAESAEVDGVRAKHTSPLLRYDADDNGIVTLAEFDAARLTKFSEADSDDNQLLEGEELKGLHAKFNKGGREGRGKRGDHGDRFERADTDGDGFVTESEVVAAAGEKFNHIDEDGDGFLTKEDHPKRKRGNRGGDAEGAKERGAERHAEVDTDGDGKVSQAEFAAKMWAHMSKLDADGDTRVSLEEAKAGKAQMRERHAKMGEGKDEKRGKRGKRGHDEKHGGKMAKLDVDGDGAVSLDEYNKMGAEMFARMDADKSETLEGDELKMRGKRGKRGGR